MQVGYKFTVTMLYPWLQKVHPILWQYSRAIIPCRSGYPLAHPSFRVYASLGQPHPLDQRKVGRELDISIFLLWHVRTWVRFHRCRNQYYTYCTKLIAECRTFTCRKRRNQGSESSQNFMILGCLSGSYCQGYRQHIERAQQFDREASCKPLVGFGDAMLLKWNVNHGVINTLRFTHGRPPLRRREPSNQLQCARPPRSGFSMKPLRRPVSRLRSEKYDEKGYYMLRKTNVPLGLLGGRS
ncbi:hypothetical protein AG1IA_01457 [Rhizoctonia solani AG-1 IA]|uniref:Uncharacterized protein n=1 Tax=Thanatephorus cucumeris (strain AG1-IA) TaxID=983506 RepID=L8X2P2_THACA|nr:hypothetical protein AG1IA_01457 [Rhizoctonia solani AG-1 IA]